MYVVLFALNLQGGIVAASAGSYRPALSITGMTANMELHLDDFEVGLETLPAMADTPGFPGTANHCCQATCAAHCTAARSAVYKAA